MTSQAGQALRQARAERGIELEEVEGATKIRAKFLRAIEEERWNELPEPVYARGFISTYAGYLGVDPDPLVEEYRRAVEGPEEPHHVPYGVVKRGHVDRRRSLGTPTLVAAGLVTAVLAGLVIVAALGSSGGGGGGDRKQADKSRQSRSGGETATSTSTSTTANAVSVALRATDAVWVCLVDQRGRPVVDSETLTAGEARGPYDGSGFSVTFGNGSVEMTVDGEPAKVPAVAEPVGFRISADGVHRLDPAAQPTCL